MTKTIVVPLDGSELAEKALPWGAMMARELELSLTLVRIVPWPEFPVNEVGYIPPAVYDDVLQSDREAAQEYLGHLQSQLGEDGITVSTVIRNGPAPEAIHDVADESGAVAVVMSSHGRGGVVRLVLGSVAERLLEDATVPVLLVRDRQSTRPPAFQRILVPLDGSTLAERGVDEAREVMSGDGTLVLVRVVEPIYQVIGTDAGGFVVDDVETARVAALSAEYLDRMAARLGEVGITVETVLAQGRPASEINRTAQEKNADAIVTTTHGLTGPARWLMGSVTDEVFRHADRPVLIVSVRTAAARSAGNGGVRDLMTRDVEVIDENETVISTVRKLLRRRVSGAPVVNRSGELVGVISEHDLLTWHRRLVDELALGDRNLDPTAYAERIETDTVRELVSRPAIEIDEDASLAAASRLLTERRIRRLPVTRNRRLVGIIARADLLRSMAARIEPLAELARV